MKITNSKSVNCPINKILDNLIEYNRKIQDKESFITRMNTIIEMKKQELMIKAKEIEIREDDNFVKEKVSVFIIKELVKYEEHELNIDRKYSDIDALDEMSEIYNPPKIILDKISELRDRILNKERLIRVEEEKAKQIEIEFDNLKEEQIDYVIENYHKELTLSPKNSKYEKLREKNINEYDEISEMIKNIDSYMYLDKTQTHFSIAEDSVLNTTQIPKRKFLYKHNYSSIFLNTLKTNKTFYLIKNKRQQEMLNSQCDIDISDIGGNHCCKKLKKNYEYNLSATKARRDQCLSHLSHVRSSSLPNRKKLYSGWLENTVLISSLKQIRPVKSPIEKIENGKKSNGLFQFNIKQV